MLWTRTGDQGPNWNVAYINVNSAGRHRLVFKGVASTDVVLPTVAIDDIKILESKCGKHILKQDSIPV